MRLEELPLEARAQVVAELDAVWHMKDMAEVDNNALTARIAELEDAILDWHREDRDSKDQDRASMRLYDVAEVIRKAKGLDLGHNH